MNPEQRKTAHVLFDEFHSESWSISLERAREMQPERTANSSYHRAAAALLARDFTVARNIAQPLDPAALAGTDVLVLLHPGDARWERTTSHGSPALQASEIAAIQAFVRAGGGLLVVTECEHDKYGDNLNDLLAPARLRIENGTAFDNSAYVHENRRVAARGTSRGFAARARRRKRLLLSGRLVHRRRRRHDRLANFGAGLPAAGRA